MESLETQLGRNHLFYLDNASVRFGKHCALDSIHLTVARGEVLFVTGASGAGKTTLLNLLAGRVKATSGRVFRPSSSTFMATVFQDYRLIPSDTGEDSLWVAYDSSVYAKRSEFKQDMRELCDFLGMTPVLSQKVSELSGGMKQRLAVVRALLSRPEVLLADEPTAALDRENATKLFEAFHYFNSKKGMSVIWSSHNRELARQFPGRMVQLDMGRVVYTGNACFIS